MTNALNALRAHWPEYSMEAAELGAFMISACLVVVWLEHPSSTLHAILPDATLRRVLTGMGMGVTAIAIVYSPWGKQSGAHFNPALTLTFWRLGKIPGWDAVFYAAAHFLGAALGVWIAGAILGERLAHPSVNFVATLPGASGAGVAFVAEAAISFVLMTVVLQVSSRPALAPYTGCCCGVLVATWISIEAPLSGMSMNPARTFGSALLAGNWTAWWIYFTAPTLGMLAAAELFVRRRTVAPCAKLHQ